MAKIQIKNSFITSSGVIQISSSGVVFDSNITASGLKLTSLISASSSGYVLGVDDLTGNIFKTPVGSALQTGSTYPITASWAISASYAPDNLCGFTDSTTPNNTAIGCNALSSNSTGDFNSAFGVSSLASNTTGYYNSAFGGAALRNNTVGYKNSAFGYYTLSNNQTGNNNSAFGAHALKDNLVDNNNAFGYQALTANTYGTNNNAFGIKALYSNLFGSNNNAFGNQALNANTYGNRNNAFGYKAMSKNTEGFSNSAFGHLSLNSNTFGYGNNAFGASALRYNEVGENNSAFGYFALRKNVSGNKNSAFGNYALRNNETGNSNNAFGYNALKENLVDNNNAFGFGALMSNGSGINNSAFGHLSLTKNNEGVNNSAFGYLALASNSYGYLTISSSVVYNVKFALLGDSGKTGYLGITQQVADGIKSNNPDFVIHLGDANYTDETTVFTNFLNFWSDYDYSADMYLAFGNHDLDYDYGASLLRQLNVVRGLIGEENIDKKLLCYDFIRGPVHFFVLNSGNTASGEALDETADPNIQLQAQLDLLTPKITASTIAWKVLVVHKPPFTNSENHRPGAIPLRLDYKALGIDVVLSAHGHDYEHFSIDDISYFVQGLGGAEVVCATTPKLPGTVKTYCNNYAYTIVEATLTETSRSISFITYDIDGTIVDTVSIEKEGGTSGTATAGTGRSTSSAIGSGSGSGSGGGPGVNAGGEVVTVKMSGQSNNAFGTRALQLNKSGYYSNAFGSYALFNNLVNSNNAFGYRSLAENTSGLYNSAFGHETLTKNISGYNNSAFGYRALAENRTIYTQTFVPASGGPAGALVFDSVADYLWYKNGSPVSFDIGTNDFTLEFYLYLDSTFNTGGVVFILGDVDPAFDITNGTSIAFTKNGNDAEVYIPIPGGITTIDFTNNFNTWTHIAFSRNSGVFKFYINGVVQVSSANSVNFTDTSLIFGDWTRGLSAPGQGFVGQISGVRLINGTGLYPSAFTPTEPGYTTESGCVVLVNSPTEVEKFDNTSGNTTTLEQIGVTWGGVVFGSNVSTEPSVETTVVGTGYNNSAFGSKALSSNTIGNSNSAFGTYALNKNTIGYNNSAFGDKALYSNYTGSFVTTGVNYSSLSKTIDCGVYSGIYHQVYYQNPGPANFGFGTNDYTVEFWVNLVNISYNKSVIFSLNDSYYGYYMILGFESFDESLKLYIDDPYNPVATILDSATVNNLLVGKSAHIAVSRSGTTLYVYINGSLVYTGTDSQNYSYYTNITVSGRYPSEYNQGINGYIGSVRVLNGTALYTGESTICVTEPPFISVTNTVLLLDYANDNKFGYYQFFYNKADSYPGETYVDWQYAPSQSTLSTNYCSSSTFSYLETNGNNNSAFGKLALASNTGGDYNSAFGSYALSKNNIAKVFTEEIITAQKTIPAAEFNGYYYSVYYLSNYNNFDIGTNDYTFEFWVELYSTIYGNKAIIAAIKSGDVSIIVAIGFEASDDNLKLYVGDYNTPVATILDSATVNNLLVGKSAHIALSRSGTTLYVYINGSLVYTGTDNQNYSSNITINTSGIYNYWYDGFSGRLSSVRVLNGTSLYNGESTICVTEPPFTNIANTVLLLNYEGAYYLQNKADAPNVQPNEYNYYNSPSQSTLDATYCVVSGSYSYLNGTKNSAFGANALLNINGGNNNVAVGYNAGSNIFAGNNNIIIGADVLAHDPSGSAQINIANFIFGIHPSGSYATGSATTVDGKLGIGIDNPTNTLHVSASVNPLRLTGLITGSVTYNLGVDADGVVYKTTGGGSAFCGYTNISIPSGSNSNTAFGCKALISGQSNVYAYNDKYAVPYSRNSAFGYQSLYKNVTGWSNSAFGYQSAKTWDGINNTTVGDRAMMGKYIDSSNALKYGYFSVFSGNSVFGRSAFKYAGAFYDNTKYKFNNVNVPEDVNVGYSGGWAEDGGQLNSVFGKYASMGNFNGSANSIFGAYAGQGNKEAVGFQFQLAYGYSPITPWGTSAFGFSSQGVISADNFATSVGAFSLATNVPAKYGPYPAPFTPGPKYPYFGGPNNAFGAASLSFNQYGYGNNAFGYRSLQQNNGSKYNDKYSDQWNAVNNSAFGNRTLTHNAGKYNSAFGAFALSSNGNSNNSGQFHRNSAFGALALFQNSGGTDNIAIGFKAMIVNGYNNSYNIAIGNNALKYNGNDSNANTVVGHKALYPGLSPFVDSGKNTIFGYKSVGYNYGSPPSSFKTLAGVSAFGYKALYKTDNYNVDDDGDPIANSAFGFKAGYSDDGSGIISAFGHKALASNTGGTFNSAFGSRALSYNTTGFSNSAFGYKSLTNNTTGFANSAFGDVALKYNTTGVANTAVGFRSLVFNTTGTGNNAVGFNALRNNTSGNYNSAFGALTLYNNISGNNNNAFGNFALQSNTTNNNNAFGYKAGSNITTGNKNIIIGHNVYAPSATGNGQLNIANLIFATGSFGETTTVTTGAKVGIGTNTPTYTLEVNGSFGATTKSFLIKHPDPNKKNMYLEHGVTESPEHTVFVRGKLVDNNIIELPDYWPYLVDSESITVTLTPIGKYQKLYVVDIVNNQVIVGNDDNTPVNCYYYIVAERKDIPKLIVEK